MKSRNATVEAVNEQDDDAIKVVSGLRERSRTLVYTCLHESRLYGNRGQAASHSILPYIIYLWITAGELQLSRVASRLSFRAFQ